jgi:uncharacterized coiled-coil protein SlyX
MTRAAFDAPPDLNEAAIGATFLLEIHDQLEQARREIEQRFLSAGDVLVEAHENIQVLIQALDRITGSFEQTSADQTIGALQNAISELHGRIERETGRAEDLRATARKLTAIQGEISKIRAILRYLAACAVSTRVAAAGNDKFMAFANEIGNYVRNAEQEVAGFSRKVTQMSSELDRIGEEHKHAVAFARSAVDTVSPQLMEAAEAIERRRAQLEQLAGRAAPVMHAAASKFTDALSALQIGDMTRQRIEHVQENIRALLDMMRREPDVPGICVPAAQLFNVLTASLSAEFDKDTRNVVGALRGVVGNARDIYHLVRNLSGQADPGADPTNGIVKDRLGAMRDLVVEIEQAGRRSAGVDATIKRLAVELLDNRGDIGNLRQVQGDIRLLAINAYLHGSQMGDLGRTIGAIATEINLEGEKLGRSANAILQALTALGWEGEKSGRSDVGRDLVADLDAVGAALQKMDDESSGSIRLIATQGEAIAERIETVVRSLDFSGQLGERLAACSMALRKAASDARPGPSRTNPQDLQTFSEQAYARYTMQSERDLHLTVFTDMQPPVASNDQTDRAGSASEDEVEDFFL